NGFRPSLPQHSDIDQQTTEPLNFETGVHVYCDDEWWHGAPPLPVLGRFPPQPSKLEVTCRQIV
ncbi:MAG: hypothetical protein ACKPKO_35990, partial [Candidatus Fonsibacter sp.]